VCVSCVSVLPLCVFVSQSVFKSLFLCVSMCVFLSLLGDVCLIVYVLVCVCVCFSVWTQGLNPRLCTAGGFFTTELPGNP